LAKPRSPPMRARGNVVSASSHCAREAQAPRHLVHGFSRGTLEQSGKVIRTVASLLRHQVQGELLTQVRADERQHLLDLALTQPSWRRGSHP